MNPGTDRYHHSYGVFEPHHVCEEASEDEVMFTITNNILYQWLFLDSEQVVRDLPELEVTIGSDILTCNEVL